MAASLQLFAAEAITLELLVESVDQMKRVEFVFAAISMENGFYSQSIYKL